MLGTFMCCAECYRPISDVFFFISNRSMKSNGSLYCHDLQYKILVELCDIYSFLYHTYDIVCICVYTTRLLNRPSSSKNINFHLFIRQ